ncbi:unnamed protein product, partial [Staurois parvus]
RLSLSSTLTCRSLLSVASAGESGARGERENGGKYEEDNLAGEPGGEAQPVCVRTSGAKSRLGAGVFLRRNGPPT